MGGGSSSPAPAPAPVPAPIPNTEPVTFRNPWNNGWAPFTRYNGNGAPTCWWRFSDGIYLDISASTQWATCGGPNNWGYNAMGDFNTGLQVSGPFGYDQYHNNNPFYNPYRTSHYDFLSLGGNGWQYWWTVSFIYHCENGNDQQYWANMQQSGNNGNTNQFANQFNWNGYNSHPYAMWKQYGNNLCMQSWNYLGFNNWQASTTWCWVGWTPQASHKYWVQITQQQDSGGYMMCLWFKEFDQAGNYVGTYNNNCIRNNNQYLSASPVFQWMGGLLIEDVMVWNTNGPKSSYTQSMTNSRLPCSYASSNCQNCQNYYGNWDYSCNGCNNGWYGQHCDQQCPSGCVQCNQQAGNWNAYTCYQCSANLYGASCTQTCPGKCNACTTGSSNNNYVCVGCQPGYYGTSNFCAGQCNTTCVPNVCGADSTLTPPYRCDTCEHGYYGKHCQSSCSATNCDPLSCYNDNGDTQYGYTCCSNHNVLTSCKCISGYVGTHCEIPCTGNAPNSTCQLTYNSNTTVYDFQYSSGSCYDNWTGPKCNIPCSSRCGPNGCAVLPSGNDYYCLNGCPNTTFWGLQCKNVTCQVGDPVSSARMNWKLGYEDQYNQANQIGYATSTCACLTPWYDQYNGQNNQFGVVNATCNNYCNSNNGNIVLNATTGLYNCQCLPGYIGSMCETTTCGAYTHASAGPCLNNGTCSDVSGTSNTTCTCPSGYVGSLCEYRVNFDLNNTLASSIVFRYPLLQSPPVDVTYHSNATLPASTAIVMYKNYYPNLPTVYGTNMHVVTTPTASNIAISLQPLANWTLSIWLQTVSGLASDFIYTPLQSIVGGAGVGIKRVASTVLTPYCSYNGVTVSVTGNSWLIGNEQLVWILCSYNSFNLTMTAFIYDVQGYLSLPMQQKSVAATLGPLISNFQLVPTTATITASDFIVFQKSLSSSQILSMYNSYVYTQNPCASEYTCLNGGSCTSLGGPAFACHCVSGFAGTNCENQLCSYFPNNNPCEHGAACNDGNGQLQYTCGCIPPYDGTYCQTCSITVNTNNDCTCITGTYSAISGQGPLNSTSDACSLSCANGDVIQTGPNQFTCSCHSGYTGTDCSTTIDYCNTQLYSNPCPQNGNCAYTSPGKFLCTCPSGTTGPGCGTQINSCDPSQFNQQLICVPGHGNCTNLGLGAYSCGCVFPWTGSSCNQLVNQCNQEPCLNSGKCTPYNDGTYTCSCALGTSWYGQNCDQWDDPCQNKQACLNGGICYSTPGYSSYTCLCPIGYAGSTCNQYTCAHYSDPIHAYCQHGGACVDGQGTLTASCACTGPWAGSNCTQCLSAYTNQTDCSCLNGHYSVRSGVGPLLDQNDFCSLPCVNGYIDIDQYSDYYCHCYNGWSQSDCSQWNDPCKKSSNLNYCNGNGKCLSTYGYQNISCACNVGWQGNPICSAQSCVTNDLNIDISTCSCQGNYYDTMYGQLPQYGNMNATCTGHCVMGRIQQGEFDGIYYCECDPAFGLTSCVQWIDPCTNATACPTGYVCDSLYGSASPICQLPPAAPATFVTTYTPYLGGFGGTGVVITVVAVVWGYIFPSKYASYMALPGTDPTPSAVKPK